MRSPAPHLLSVDIPPTNLVSHPSCSIGSAAAAASTLVTVDDAVEDQLASAGEHIAVLDKKTGMSELSTIWPGEIFI